MGQDTGVVVVGYMACAGSRSSQVVLSALSSRLGMEGQPCVPWEHIPAALGHLLLPQSHNSSLLGLRDWLGAAPQH